MKTSKKILIVFLSIFCLSLLSVMITVENPKGRRFNFEEVVSELPDINVVMVHKGANVDLTTNDSCFIKYSHEKDSLKMIPYQIVMDTLILKPLKSGNLNLYYSVNLKQIDKLLIAGGNVGINLHQDSIEVVSNKKGSVKVNKNSSFDYLKLDVQQKSRTQIYTKHIKTLEMLVANSEVFTNSRIPRVKVQAENKASIRLQHVKNLQVNCDSTSTYRIY